MTHDTTNWAGPGCCPRHLLRPDLASAPCDFDGTTPLDHRIVEANPHLIHCQDCSVELPCDLCSEQIIEEAAARRFPRWHPQIERMARWGVG